MARTLAACLISLAVATSAACSNAPADSARRAGSGESAAPKDSSQVIAATPGGQSLVLEVARSDQERARGLMFRSEVPRGTGMIFLFGAPGPHPIWMFNCKTELDIIWLNDDGQIVHLFENAPVCAEQPCESYSSPVNATLVIEVAAGHARPAGLLPGSRVLLTWPDGRPFQP